MKSFYGMHGNRQKIGKKLQQDRNSTLMRCETDILTDCVTNTQSDIIIHSKTQTDKKINRQGSF